MRLGGARGEGARGSTFGEREKRTTKLGGGCGERTALSRGQDPRRSGTGPAAAAADSLRRDQVDWVAADVHFPGRDVLAGAERAVLDLPPTATRTRRIAR